MNTPKILKICAVLLIISILSVTFLGLNTASWVDKRVQKTLKKNGLNISNIETVEKRIGAIRYTNIQLDSNGKSFIQSLIIQYNPLIWRDIKSISVDGAYLSGEIDINNTATIAGIQNFIFSNLSQSIPAQEIKFKNINFSILSAHLGGIRGTINASATSQNNDQIWTGNITTKQPQFELIAKISGQLNQSGSWIGEMEIENAKIERNDLKLTRVNGIAEFKGSGKNWQETNVNLNAGGTILHNTPWQNTSINITQDLKTYKTIISSKSSGIQGLELTAEYSHSSSGKIHNWNTSIYSENGKALVNYLSSQGLLPIEEKDLKPLNNQNNLKLSFKPHQKNLVFDLKNESQNIVAKGIIKTKQDEKYTVSLAAKNSVLSDISKANCKKAKAKNQTICHFKVIQDANGYRISNLK